MKNRLLSLFAMALVAIGMNAQTWAEPTAPTEASDPISGHVYQVMNAESNFALAGGTTWFSWNTTAMLIDPEAGEPIRFTLEENFDEEGNSLGWTMKGYDGTWPNNYVFVSGNDIEGFAMHVDNPTDVHRYFELLKQENGFYHIRVAAADATFGEAAVDGWADKCWGWGGYDDPTGQSFAVYAEVNPEDGYFCDWYFVDYSVYFAKKDLYALAMTIEEEGLDVKYSAYDSVYEGNDLDALLKAKAELSNLIRDARVAVVFNYGEDGINPPSPENPADVTSIIDNPEFLNCVNGSFPGWTIVAPNGGNTWVNGTDYVEYWNGTAANGQFDYYQEIAGLPAGRYTLTASMWNSMNGVAGTFEPTSGVYGKTSIGTVYALVTDDCDNGNLHEYTTGSIILVDGDTLRIGVKNAKTMVARWFGVDYIHMNYYGPVEEDPMKLALDDCIAQNEARFGTDMDEVRANKDVKEAYAIAMEYAKNTDEYQAAIDSLNNAGDKLALSVSEYKVLGAKIEDLEQKQGELEQQWTDLDLGDFIDEINQGYQEGTFTSEDIAAIDGRFMEIVGQYISENCKAGDDLTILLTNPSFDTGNLNGWVDKTGGGAGFGSYNGNGENSAGTMTAEYLEEVGEPDPSTWGINCEVYHRAFDFSQTIKNLPPGMYKFTCQGFWRGKNESTDDSDDTPAQLYAVLGDGSEQTDNLSNLAAGASEDQLYSNGGGWGTDVVFNNLYAPYCMSGAMYHFHHKNDGENYDYTSSLSIILTEASDITVGVRTTSGGTWVIFDNFRITYLGNDANVYYDRINELIAKAEAVGLGDEDIMTTEAFNVIEGAIAKGTNAMDNGTTEDCIAAITGLQEAIAFGENTLKLTAQLKKEYGMTNDYRLVSYEGSSSYAGLQELLDELGSKLFGDGFTDNAEVETYIIALKREFTKYVQADNLDATEEDARDLTAAIYNPRGFDYDATRSLNGWTLTDCSAGFYTVMEGESAITEFFNQTFDMRQTIYGLAPGYYRLGVKGYYRNGLPADVEKAMNGELAEDSTLCVDEPLVTLFAGEAETTLLRISANMTEYQELAQGAQITVNGEQLYIPNSMAEGSAAFENEMYQNILQFQVTEGQDAVEIGLKKTEAVEADWTLFGLWTLEYLGAAEPAEDATTTTIQGVETSLPVAKAAIFNLAGQRVAKAQKGIYVINGRKVVVK